MRQIEIHGMWNIFQGILKQKWSRLTRNEFQFAQGKFEEIVGHVQMLTGETYRRLKMPAGK